MNRYFVAITFVIYVIFSYNSCYTTTVNLGSFRDKIIEENSDIKSIGFIPNYTGTDDKFIAIEIIFNDGRYLYLTLVNYINLPHLECPFNLSRIGNYGFDVFSNYLNDAGERQIYFDDSGKRHIPQTFKYHDFPISMITDEIGISFPNNKGNLSNLNIVIKNYDAILNYVNSLPSYSESYGDVFDENNYNFKMKPTGGGSWQTDTPENKYWEYYIVMKADWNDEFYNWDKRPNYNESGSFTFFILNVINIVIKWGTDKRHITYAIRCAAVAA
ncbi:hypothetical protein FACS1894130_02980 [Spirochaetia bacterium]|nr:hypothetical protein FACS1894130_02980 [Spirochaetia bacterium]